MEAISQEVALSNVFSVDFCLFQWWKDQISRWHMKLFSTEEGSPQLPKRLIISNSWLETSVKNSKLSPLTFSNAVSTFIVASREHWPTEVKQHLDIWSFRNKKALIYAITWSCKHSCVHKLGCTRFRVDVGEYNIVLPTTYDKIHTHTIYLG